MSFNTWYCCWVMHLLSLLPLLLLLLLLLILFWWWKCCRFGLLILSLFFSLILTLDDGGKIYCFYVIVSVSVCGGMAVHGDVTVSAVPMI